MGATEYRRARFSQRVVMAGARSPQIVQPTVTLWESASG